MGRGEFGVGRGDFGVGRGELGEVGHWRNLNLSSCYLIKITINALNDPRTNRLEFWLTINDKWTMNG